MALRGALALLLLWRACPESGATEDEAAWLQLPLRRSRAPLAQLCVPNAYGFDGFNFDIATGIECMRQVTVPLGPAVQNLRALAAFYEEFYVFETTVVDPAKPLHAAVPGWEDLGQWGTTQGGGDAPNATKTPLVAGLRALADSLEATGADPPILEVFGPLNELLAGIRDCHTKDAWRSYGDGGGDSEHGAPLMHLLSMFHVHLGAEGGDGVLLKVENALTTEPDGAATPRVVDQTGRVVRSVNGVPPLDWLVSSLAMKKILGRWTACEKSLGARVNELIRVLPTDGVQSTLVAMGSLAALQGTFAVRYEDGTEAAWSFRLTLATVPNFAWQDVASSTKNAASHAGRFKTLLARARAQTKADWHVSAPPPSLLGSSAPSPPPAQTAPPGAFPAGLPQNEEQWHLGKPGLFQRVYGYFEARTDSEGQSYMLWKMATFVPPAWGCPTEDLYCFKAFWGRLIEAAKAKGATRLLVDIAGNGGGDTGLALQFIAALTAPLKEEEACVYYRAPIRRSYEMWKAMDGNPVVAFLNSEEAIRERYPHISDELWSRFEVLLSIAVKDFLLLSDEDLESIGFRSQDSTWVLPKPGSAQELQQLFARLVSVSSSNIQVANMLYGNPFDGGMVHAPDYDDPEVLHQGGIAKNFTRKVPHCAPVQEFQGALAHPFEQILLLSDGTCGSSCDTATRNSYIFSRLAEQHGTGGGLRTRYITFGGPGGSAAEAKKVLGGTSFPGGNIDSNVTSGFKNAFAQTLLIMAGAKLAGEEALFQQGLAYVRFLGSLVPDWAYAEPAYAETAAYSKLGLEVPDEFLFLPTDLYLPNWYYGVAGGAGEPSKWNATELARMHADAARAFAAF